MNVYVVEKDGETVGIGYAKEMAELTGSKINTLRSYAHTGKVLPNGYTVNLMDLWRSEWVWVTGEIRKLLKGRDIAIVQEK